MPRPLSSRSAYSVVRVASVAVAFAGLATAPSSVRASLWDWTSVSESVTSAALTEGLWDAYVTLPDADATNPDTNWHNERNPVHGALLRNPLGSKGKVLMFRHFKWFVAELDTAATLRVEDIGTYWDQGPWPFCGGHSVMPDGKLLISGGDHSYYDNPVGYPVKSPADSVPEFVPDPWASTFDPYDNEYAVIDSMLGLPRWYPTNVLMPDGSTWVVAGDFWDVTKDTLNVGHPNNGEFTNVIPWIRWDGSTWEEVDPEPLGWNDEEDHARATTPLYPFFHVMPSGLFYAGAQHGDSLYASCEVCKSRLWAWEDAWPNFDAGAPSIDDRVYNHDHGICVQLTLAPPYYEAFGGSERVLLAGGGRQGHSGQQMPPYPDAPNLRGPHPMAEIFEGGASPSWTAIDPMLYPRKEANGTLLPDGRVFVSGGHYVANPCFDLICDIGTNVGNSPVLESEMFDPADDSWTEMDDLTFSYGRKYHSFALLLPDARVLTAGNQNIDGDSGAGQNYEIYYPPYLFVDDDPVRLRTASERPEIAGVDSTIAYGFPFFVEFDQVTNPDSVQACLIAPSAVTHGNNMTQRRVLLACEPAVVDGDTLLAVTAPWEPEIAPPGYYLLFLLEDGIPSEAAWVKLQQPADYVVGDGETELWAGTVHLDRPFTVEEGGMLKILPGTKIFAWAERDSSVGGSGRSRVTIQGGIQAEGTEESPITFTSHLGSNESTDWDGLFFELAGVERTTYGYAWCLPDTGYCASNPLAADSCAVNLLKYVEIENATAGVTISTLRAPSLDSVTFTNIQGNRHIYLDGADVVLSPNTCATGNWHTYWNLLPGTHVVASTTVDSGEQLSYGDATKVELVVFGGLIGIGEANAPIVFEAAGSTAPTAWGGITLRNEHDVLLRYADIGYAATPVFIYSPWAKAAIEYSTIHDFAETGIWMKSCRGGGTSLDSVRVANCVITREGLASNVGDTGIWLEDSDNARVTGTQILFGSEAELAVSGVGIDVTFNTGLCSSSASPMRTALLQDNIVVGPGVNAEEGTHSGIRLTGMCGHTYRDIDVLENDVENWNYAGLEITQSSDVQVSCNRVEVNKRGVHLMRSTATSNPVRFRHNTFRALAQDSTVHAVATNDTSGIAIGNQNATRGHNWITAHQTDTKLARNTDTDSLDATDNAWYVNVTGAEQTADSLLAAQPGIEARLAGAVRVADFLDDDPSWSCTTPDTCVTCTGSGARQAGVASRAPDAPDAPGDEPILEAAAPRVRELGKAVPNPSRGVVDIALAIPARDTGRYTLEVFDAAGRRVYAQDSDLGTPGRYQLRWNGRDGSGQRAGAGVFFLRVRGPSFSELRKVVLIQ